MTENFMQIQLEADSTAEINNSRSLEKKSPRVCLLPIFFGGVGLCEAKPTAAVLRSSNSKCACSSLPLVSCLFYFPVR